MSSTHSFWPVTGNLLFLNKRKREKSRKDGREDRFYICTVCTQSGHATNRATAPGVWIPKMFGWEGAIDGTHTSSDMVLKND